MPEPLRVLLVEDNEDDALLLVEELRAGGFAPNYARVVTAEAMRQELAQASWELVLADYALPNFSGQEALRTLRQSGQDLPFIVVSGTVTEQQAIDMMRQGAHDFILKQSLGRLVPAVRRELREAASRRERRHVEEALLEQEAQLRLITDNSPDAIITIDETSIIRFVNPATETIFGYTIAEMQDQPITMLMPERFRETHLAAMREYITQGKRHLPSWSGNELIGLHRSGREFALEVSYGEFLRANRRFFIGVMRDISDRKQAEERLSEERALLRIVIDTVPNFIGVKNWEGQFMLANRALAEVYGTTVENIIGKTDADFNPNAEEVAWFRHDDREVMRTCSTKYIPEEKVTDSTGHVRWLSTVKVPLIEKVGSCSRVLLATHDITARKEAEEALAREQAFLASAIELLPFPIIFNTLSGEVLRANQAAYRFFGDLGIGTWWHRELLNSVTHEPIPRDEWPMMRAAQGEVVPAVEGILQLPDGREVDVLAVAAPIRIDDHLAATVVAFMDITPIKEADRAKTRFLAILSHELRTPLANILGWVKQARETPEVIEEALSIIQRNADAQRRMLERLLEISRLLYGKFDLNRQAVDLWQIVANVLQSLRPEAEARSIMLDIQAPSLPLPVYGDVKRLGEAIESVLDNALCFTAAGRRILVQGRRIDMQAEIVILSTGCGLPPEVLPHVFDLFQVSPEIAKTGGSLGLGMPLAKAILDRHGGRITIASPGEGQECTVTITLPLEDSKV